MRFTSRRLRHTAVNPPAIQLREVWVQQGSSVHQGAFDWLRVSLVLIGLMQGEEI